MNKKFLIIIAALVIGACGFVAGYLILATIRESSSAPPTPASDQTQADEAKTSLACIALMPLRQRIAQKIMAAGYSAYLADEVTLFSEASIGGVIIMDESSAEQIAAFREAMPITPFVAVDQEGGTVQRYKNGIGLPGAEEMAAHSTPESAYQQYSTDSKQLKDTGITTNFAPVVDVSSRTPAPLPGRMYASNPEIATKYATASITAAQKNGITPVIKHFPGLGSATGNTDFTPATTDPLSVLESRDLLPYKELASLHPDVMVGNMIVPGLTDGQPAIWSHQAITLLRSLGYQNSVVYSDSLTALAVPGNIEEAAVKTWAAGVDVAVIVQADNEAPGLSALFASIISSGEAALASGALNQDELNRSILRIFIRKQIDPCALSGS